MRLKDILQHVPYLRKYFIDKLSKFSPDISETRLIILDDDDFQLASYASDIKDNLKELDGQRTVGLTSYYYADAQMSSRPFVGSPGSSYYYQSDQYVQNATRFEGLIVRAPGFNGSIMLALNRLEELVVDPTGTRSSNLNRGGGGGGGDGDIGILYSNLRRSDVSGRKRKVQDPTKRKVQDPTKRKVQDPTKRKPFACGHCRDHHPDDPCGAKMSWQCTKPCRNTCGA